MNASDDLARPPATIRPAAFADLSGLLSIRQAQEVADSGMALTTADRLADEWKALGHRLADQVWVAVTAANHILAYVELDRADQVFILRLWALSDHTAGRLLAALLAKAEEQVCKVGREESIDSVTLFSQATSSHPEAQQALTQSAFALLSTYEKMELALNELPAPPQDISGIEIRPFAPGQDAESIYRADEEAFIDQRGHTPRTFEQWRKRLTFDEETFDPSVWLIAWDADEVAGAALGEVAKGVGWIHHLFVRRPWRRHGLGSALMLAVLGSFHGHGVGLARLNVDAQSLTNAHQLYRRLGFQVTGEYSNYEKVLPLV
jgi:GNAT superfamily N-acetyltransferase